MRSPLPASFKTNLGPAFLLVGAVFLFYLPVFRNGFVTFDDPIAIMGNTHIRSLSWENLKWMATSFYSDNWMPMTWLSFSLDYAFGGLTPWVYHFTNLVFYSLDTVLVFLLLLRFLSLADPKPGRESSHRSVAFWAALWFGVHPIHVESVAWAVERKDVLYAFFYLAALWVYLGVRGQGRTRTQWWTCGGFLVLACLSKPMAVTLPFIFLLLDFWPLGRWKKEGRKILLEKIPFFLLVSAEVFIVFISHGLSEQKTSSIPGLSLTFRVMNAFRSLVFYFVKTFWPADLVPLYPVPRTADNWYYLENAAALGVVVGLFVAAWVWRRKFPVLGAALGFYVLSLLPVLGLIQAGGQAAADRYSFLAGLVFFLPSAWIFTTLLWERPILRRVLGLSLTAVLGILTWNQISVWQDPIHFWERVVNRFPGQSAQAHNDLGLAYQQAGRSQEALYQYDQAILLLPQQALLHDDRGTVLLEMGRTQEAVLEFKTALALEADDVSAYRNLWYAERKEGDRAAALTAVQKAVELDPANAEAWNNLGISEGEVGHGLLAIADFQKAVALEPTNPSYVLNLAKTYEAQKNWGPAIEGYQRALMLDPNQATAWFGLGKTYEKIGNWGGALSALENADRLVPGNAMVRLEMQKAQKNLKAASKP